MLVKADLTRKEPFAQSFSNGASLGAHYGAWVKKKVSGFHNYIAYEPAWIKWFEYQLYYVSRIWPYCNHHCFFLQYTAVELAQKNKKL